ncbi:hypothetical protein, partial [Burkholderia gladioli]|uniref:hypothetical protein n=1 Tax=Burkholderia gladioli TaxID=28095 RepID=UPI003F7AD51F
PRPSNPSLISPPLAQSSSTRRHAAQARPRNLYLESAARAANPVKSGVFVFRRRARRDAAL